MKKQILIATAFVAAISSTNQLSAQENLRPVLKIKTKSNVKNDKVSVITLSATATGCSIVLADRAVNAESEAGAPAQSDRMHKPFVITKELDISSSDNSITEATGTGTAQSRQGYGKVSLSDVHFSIQSKGQTKELQEENGEFVLPADCTDGSCTLVTSWSWGASNGSSSKRCDKTFILTMENGVCKGITEKGIK